MRFTLISNLKQDKAMRSILIGLILFILLYLVSDVIVKYLNFGLFGNEIKNTLFGNEAEYIDAMTKGAFLEFWHTEIFFVMMMLLTLSSVFIRVANKSRLLVTNIVMLSALISLSSLALAYFISPFFIDIYVITFFIWHLGALYSCFYSLWRFYDKRV
ncbi:MAG: hypothetical protein QG559_624 [Campylobacterota bacterium]|nr:hypothetical protein [Campylobacterota bacterium]